MDPNAPRAFGPGGMLLRGSNQAVKQIAKAPAQKAAPKGPGGLKGFLINSLPAIGGTLGAIAGLPLNALDLVSGPGGTALDVGAGATGAGIGEALKQKALGQSISPKQVAIQAAEGGALSGAGAALGAAGKGAKAVTSAVAKTGLPAATDVAEGAAKTAAPELVATPTNIFQKVGQNTVQKQAQAAAAKKALDITAPFEGVDKSLLNPSGGAGGLRGAVDTMQNTLKMAPTPENMSLAADLGTGNSGHLASTMRQVLGSGEVGNVPTENALSAAQDAIGKEGIGDPGARTGTARQVLNSIRNIVSGKATSTVAGGVGNATLKPNDAFDTLQAIEGRIRSINPATATDKDAALRTGLVAAKSGLENDLYGTAGLDQAVANHVMSPAEEEDLRTDVAEKGGSKELSDYLVNSTNNAQSGRDLRSAQAPLVELGRLGDAATNVGKGTNMIRAAKVASGAAKQGSMGGLSTVYEAGSAMHGNVAALPALAAKAARTGPVAKVLAKLAPQGAEEAATNTAEAERGIGGASQLESPTPATPETTPASSGTPTGLVQGLPQDIKTAATLPVRMAGTAANAIVSPVKTGVPVLKGFAGQELGRAAGNVAATGSPSGGASVERTTGAPPNPISSGTISSLLNTAGNAANGGADTTAQSQVYTQDDLDADIMRDPTNAAKYEAIYKDLNPTPAKSDLTAAQTTSALAVKDAASALGSYAQNLSELQGSSGVGTGELSILAGKLGIGSSADKAAYALDSQRTELATQLAKATTNGKPSSTQINFWKESLPAITDNQTAAQDKLQNVAKNLQYYLESATTPIEVGQ